MKLACISNKRRIFVVMVTGRGRLQVISTPTSLRYIVTYYHPHCYYYYYYYYYLISFCRYVLLGDTAISYIIYRSI